MRCLCKVRRGLSAPSTHGQDGAWAPGVSLGRSHWCGREGPGRLAVNMTCPTGKESSREKFCPPDSLGHPKRRGRAPGRTPV